MNCKGKILDWDSNFFELKVGAIEGQVKTIADIKCIEKLNADLIYCISDYPVNKKLFPENVLFVDLKTTYAKSVEIRDLKDDNIIEYKNNSIDSDLYYLAVLSSKYSRFNADPKIPKQKVIELYHLWIENSIKSNFAEKVFVYKQEHNYAGLITIGIKEHRADVGIIAVNEKYQGYGIASKLMRSAENYAYKKGYDTIQVVTQGSNKPACKLYEKLGYIKEKEKYFYHIWNV